MRKVKLDSAVIVLGILLFLFSGYDLYAEAVQYGEAAWKKPTGGRVLSVSSSHRYRWFYALSEDRSIHCITPSGVLLWQSERLPYRPVGDITVGPDESLYVHTTRGEIYAINPAGKVVWSVGLSGPLVGNITIGTDGMLYYVTTAGIAAGRTHLGKLVWRKELDGRPLTPLEYNGDGRLRVLMQDAAILTLDMDGELVAEAHPELPEGSLGSGPRLLCDEKGIYMGYSNRIAVFDSDGAARWEKRLDGSLTDCRLTDELVAIGTERGVIYAFHKDTGDTVWTARIPDTVRFLQVPDYPIGIWVVNGRYSTYLIGSESGEIEESFLTPAPEAQPFISDEGGLYIGGEDWVVYRFNHSGLEAWGREGIKKKSRDQSEHQEPDGKILYTREILQAADRDAYLDLIDTLASDLDSLPPDAQYHSALESVHELLGTGVLNPVRRDGFIINDFPEVRVRSARLLSEFGNLKSRDILIRMLRYDWDRAVSEEIISAIGELRSDPDGLVMDLVYQLLHSGKIPLNEDPATADTIIECVDKICRYGGLVRPSASAILNELYFSPIPRVYRLQAIETLRSFGKKK